MKKYLLLATTIGFLTLGCEVDPVESTENLELNTSTEVTTNTENSVANSMRFGGGTDPALAHSLEWASFTIGNVLFVNSGYRNTLTNYIALSQSNVVPLEVFLGPTPPPGFANFKNDFITRFEFYISCSESNAFSGFHCPDTDDSPGGDHCPPCENFHAGGEGQQMIDYLLSQNCIEVYLPRGTRYSLTNNTTTTAHPLTNDASNDGYFRTTNIETSEKEVNTTYITNNDHTIIVLRPVRDLSDPDCTYSTISVNDFTDFLDGTW